MINNHRKNQIKVIDLLEQKFKDKKISAVRPVDNFKNDPRICLTTVHFPKKYFINKIFTDIINPLKKVDSRLYYYKPTSLHLTIKNIRTIENPPNFTKDNVIRVTNAFTKVIPSFHKFNIYYYKLLILPYSISLLCTTDPELNKLFLKLDKTLNIIGLPDNKSYVNKKYFFINMTLARFNKPVSIKIMKKVKELSSKIDFTYTVDSASLIEANASLETCNIIHTWKLK